MGAARVTKCYTRIRNSATATGPGSAASRRGAHTSVRATGRSARGIATRATAARGQVTGRAVAGRPKPEPDRRASSRAAPAGTGSSHEFRLRGRYSPGCVPARPDCRALDMGTRLSPSGNLDPGRAGDSASRPPCGETLRHAGTKAMLPMPQPVRSSIQGLPADNDFDCRLKRE
jgi:hypothetical protein